VQVYSMGKDRWIHSPVWPLKDTRATDYHLGGWTASPAGFSSLGPTRWKAPGSASFVSDPGDPVRDVLETDYGAFDLRALSNRQDVLTFETEPFAEDMEVVGHVGAEIHASSDAPDFDLYIKLLDVAPDGTAFNLETPGHEVLRASYRDMTAEQKLLKPGEVAKLTYRNMITGNTFLKGHRLRVCLMASWYPTFPRNLQTGLLETVSSDYRKARITIHYGPKHDTKLILPIIAGQ